MVLNSIQVTRMVLNTMQATRMVLNSIQVTRMVLSTFDVLYQYLRYVSFPFQFRSLPRNQSGRESDALLPPPHDAGDHDCPLGLLVSTAHSR
jgi:hypothetical protein